MKLKKEHKGMILLVFIGGILLFWGAAASLPSNMAPLDLSGEPTQMGTVTGTPMDNFPDEQREQFCGTGSAESNTFIKEFKIPTVCTQPLAITTDPNGNVWFAQVNTGNIAKFNPMTESFTEYQNPAWPENARSMMWGIDYAPDGSLWFTEEQFDSLWRFSINDEQYSRIAFPSEGNSLPQRIAVEGSQIIVNDFTGNKITYVDVIQSGDETTYLTVPSPVDNSVTSGFVVDDGNLWYTNWLLNSGGVLVMFKQNEYFSAEQSSEGLPLFDYIDVYELPPELDTPNGLTAGFDGRIWIAETSSSFFFSFDPNTEIFTQYVTSHPDSSTFGNSTGVIKTPVSRPYWTGVDDSGRIIINEQTGNRIGIFDSTDESMIEYTIPSQNPNWGDCNSIENCGLAQVFDFTISGDKIWFTEWVENNIGVLDTSIPLPYAVNLDTQNITLKKGTDTQVNLKITPMSNSEIKITTSSTSRFSDLKITPSETLISLDSEINLPITISASDTALVDTHKILIGAQTDEVVVSQFLTVKIIQ